VRVGGVGQGDEYGEGDAAKVGQRVLVVSGGDPAPLFEPVDASFGGVATPIEIGVEGRRAASS
jgi:hypothetical protein